MTSPLDYRGGRQFPQSILDDLDRRLNALEDTKPAQTVQSADGRVVDKAMVKRLAVQYGLLPAQTERELTEECRIWEYDGAFKCMTHQNQWGAIGKPVIKDSSAPCAAQPASGADHAN